MFSEVYGIETVSLGILMFMGKQNLGGAYGI